MADSSPKDTFDELRSMVTDYARQETVDPLKRLGDWAKFGLIGAILLGIGGFLLGLGVLRLVQEMAWTENRLSFVPYMIVFVLLLTLAGLCFWAMTKKPEWLNEDNT